MSNKMLQARESLRMITRKGSQSHRAGVLVMFALLLYVEIYTF